jgi:osmotically-inducible protein OsmY
MSSHVSMNNEAAALLQRVLTSLIQTDPRIGKVQVEVIDREVRLQGRVSSYYLRSLAIEAVGRVVDGRTIDDQLSVTSSPPRTLSSR